MGIAYEETMMLKQRILATMAQANYWTEYVEPRTILRPARQALQSPRTDAGIASKPLTNCKTNTNTNTNLAAIIIVVIIITLIVFDLPEDGRAGGAIPLRAELLPPALAGRSSRERCGKFTIECAVALKFERIEGLRGRSGRANSPGSTVTVGISTG